MNLSVIKHLVEAEKAKTIRKKYKLSKEAKKLLIPGVLPANQNLIL